VGKVLASMETVWESVLAEFKRLPAKYKGQTKVLDELVTSLEILEG